MVASSTIKAMFPEFTALDDGYISIFIGIAAVVISNSSAYGSLLDSAIAFYTAHLIASSGDGSGNGVGPVTQEKVGDLSKSYGSTGLSKSALSTTKYGLQLLGLRRSTICGMPQVIV